MTYKWNSAMDWFNDAVERNDVSKGEMVLLIHEHLDSDDIQNHFESSMDEDGFFTHVDDGTSKMVFVTDCTQVPFEDVEDLDDCIENGITIDYETLIERVPESELKKYFPGYMWDGVEDSKTGNNTLEDDWSVEFCESTYKERVCYYVVWSSIEFIWCSVEND